MAYQQAYTTPLPELTARLKTSLGRPLIAYMLGVADPAIVSQWANGTLVPEDASKERLRTVAAVFFALVTITGESKAAADWFTGTNPNFGSDMPAELLRTGHVAAVEAAVRALVEA